MLEAHVMDGRALDLPSSTFDLAASEFGVMLFADLPRGLREMTRVTKSGGRGVVVALGSPAKLKFLQVFSGAVPEFTGPLMDPPPLPFQLQDPDKLRLEMVSAGLRQIRVEATGEQTSGQHFLDWVTNSNPLAHSMLGELNLTPDQTNAIRQAAEKLIRERAGKDGVAVLISLINIGIETK